MKRLLYIPLLVLMMSFVGCKEESDALQGIFNPLEYVDPFIGTGAHGHTFPGATRPNAMVQFSPDTHLLGWEASSGYHYNDSLVYGFSLTHLSGTGIGDLGDVSLLPFSNEKEFRLSRGEQAQAHFDKAKEKASAGYYTTTLDKQGIEVELTSTPRVGLMKVRYADEQSRYLLLDLVKVLQANWGHKVRKNDLVVVNDSTILGTYYTKGWAEDQQMSYCLNLSQRAKSIQVLQGKARREVRTYPDSVMNCEEALLVLIELTKGSDPLLYKVGLSEVSPENAQKNLQAELPHWDFDKVKKESEKVWKKTLSAVKIKSKDKTVMTNFYTALYHSFIAPYHYQDVEGSYRGLDKEIHQNKDLEHYTVFSIWDTYRTLHPLMTILKPERAKAFGKSLLQDYRDGSCLPRWPLASNYTGCMPAYHSVSVLVDLLKKGLVDEADLKEMALAGVNSSVYRADLAEKFQGTRELDLVKRHTYYKDKFKYIPADSIPESVSWAVEMAYDDWCISELCAAAGLDSLANAYLKKSKYYKKYWCRDYKLMRPIMSDGLFKAPFNPRFSAHEKSDYTEGNAYQWSFYAPHDMKDFIGLMGGCEQLEANLDTLFTTSSRIDGSEQSADITGLIGQYAHGNEPSHHIAYLYNYTKSPNKGQEILDKILYEFYQPTPEGIIGNEDCGQMSAWYVMSALGFYPICSGANEYFIGRPLVDEARIKIGDGIFRIVVKRNSKKNKYIFSAKINGKNITNTRRFKHKDIKSGGILEIIMSDKPRIKA